MSDPAGRTLVRQRTHDTTPGDERDMTMPADPVEDRWASVLRILAEDPRITPQLHGFLHLVEPKGVLAGTLYLEVPNDLTRGMLEQRIRIPITEAVARIGDDSVANFAITVVATLYFGWHYIADDLAGVVIALFAFWLGGLASGQKFDRRGLASHPTSTTSQVPVDAE